MDSYERTIRADLAQWQGQMKREPSAMNRLSKTLQVRVNKMIPEKVHNAITEAIKQMTRGVLTGAGVTTPESVKDTGLYERELIVRNKINVYRNTATAEGALTGAAGFLVGLADFPLWLTVKMKMLFEIAAAYGYDVKDFKERLYMLYIFQLTFSSDENRKETFLSMEQWETTQQQLPSMQDFDWRTFQQEYRDYIDLAKLLQLVPGIGAVVGGVVNHRLTQKLGTNAMQAYRMRILSQHQAVIK